MSRIFIPAFRSNRTIVMEFVRDIRHSGITWVPEISPDLVTWEPVFAYVAGKDGFKETMQVQMSSGRPFARLRVHKE